MMVEAGRRRFTWVQAAVVAGIVLILGLLAIPFLHRPIRYSKEKLATIMLYAVCQANEDFKVNDRNGDKILNYWTADVAGLYCLRSGPSGRSIKLIDLSIAAADIHPASSYAPAIAEFSALAPRDGYWLQALRHDRQAGEPYAKEPGAGATGNAFNRERYGFLTFPDEFPASGKISFIQSESMNQVKRQMPSGIRPPTPGRDVTDPMYADWPTDGDLKNNWAKFY